ncbi:MAG: DsrE/DsrF/DrsH-like family protein [bacterium]
MTYKGENPGGKSISSKESATIIVFSSDLDKVLAAFNIATGAASMGMETTMFFTFWGLNVLKKKKISKKPFDWMKRMLGMLNKGGAERLPLSKFHMMGIGTSMMKAIMKKSNFPDVKELLSMAKELGVNLIACNTSMQMMGISKEDLIPEVTMVAGVATYLAKARDSKVNLFI